MKNDSAPIETVRCHVYRSSVRDGLYVYVTVSDERESAASESAPDKATPDGAKASDPVLDGLPAPVRRQLGRPTLAMTLDLDENRRLGQEDVRVVLANLASQGFHVQMPRDIEPIVEAVAGTAISDAAARRAGTPGKESGD